MRNATASTVLTWPVLAHARARGISAGSLLEAAGLRGNDLLFANRRVPLAAVQALWSDAAQRLRDPSVGLSILSSWDVTAARSWPEPLSHFEFLFRHSATLRDGITRAARYTRLLRDGMRAELREENQRAFLQLELTAQEPWPLVQLHVGMAVLLARRVLPQQRSLQQVWFRRPAPPDARSYQSFFGVPVRFGEAMDGLVGTSEGLDLVLPEADAVRRRTNELRAEALLSELPSLESAVDQVREAVRQALLEGDVKVGTVARKLALSVRTLNRRLQSEGESYQSVLDQMRCELAKRDLASGRFSPREVGQRMGFSSVSAFYRAFKTWTGRTPAEFQQQ